MTKPVVWLASEIKKPPFSMEARSDAGTLLRRLQEGERLSMPDSRPMPEIGPRCHELRIKDNVKRKNWRIFYRLDVDAIVIAAVEPKTTSRTPKRVIDLVKKRLKDYDRCD